MNDKQAEIQGLHFTGVYSSYDFEYVKKEAKDIRNLGFRAVVTTGQGGKSVYAESGYFDHRRLESLKTLESHHQWREDNLKTKYEKDLQELREERENRLAEIEQLEKELGVK